MNNELAIAIPCYNERAHLPDLLTAYAEASGDLNWELVIIDNGSSDGTWEYLQSVKNQFPFIKPVRIEVNHGYGAGLHAGMLQCKAPVVGWTHGDLQCPPADVFKAYNLYKSSQPELVLVKGHRMKKGRSWVRLTISMTLEMVAMMILGHWFRDLNGQPKLFPRQLLETFRKPPPRYSYDVYVQYMAHKNGYKIKSFPVLFAPRSDGRSHWAKSFRSQLNAIKSFFEDIWRIRTGFYH